MVHTPEGAFEVGVCRVYVFVDILASSYIIICAERLSYIFLCHLNPFAVSLRMTCASAHGEPMFVRMEVHSLSMPIISAIGVAVFCFRELEYCWFFLGVHDVL